jgi:hypothetical protein
MNGRTRAPFSAGADFRAFGAPLSLDVFVTECGGNNPFHRKQQAAPSNGLLEIRFLSGFD